MEAATGLTESAACGHRIDELFPDLSERGMLARLTRVAQTGGVEVLAPAFHHYLITLPPRETDSSFDRMQQHVIISPMRTGGAVVTIEDVTRRLDSERQTSERLRAGDVQARLNAVEHVVATGGSATLLAGPLADSDWRVRRTAVDGIAELSGAEAVSTLINAIRDGHADAGLLNAAVTALALRHDEVLTPVVQLLGDESADVRTYAALALGLLGDRRAHAPLIEALNDAEPNVRYHAIEALGRIGDASATDALLQVIESRDFFLTFAALDALANVADAGVARRLIPLLDDPLLAQPAMDAIASLGATSVLAESLTEEAVRNLIARLPNASAEQAALTATVIHQRDVAGADEILVSLLRRPGVGETAAALLATRGHSAAVALSLVDTLDDENLRRPIAVLLGRIGSVEGVPALLRLMGDADPLVVAAAANALAAVGDYRAFEPLLDLLDREDITVRHAAVSALSSLGHPSTTRAMLARLRDASPRVRESAARIAAYLGDDASLDGLVDLCADEAPTVRRAAVEHLANFDESRVVDTIRRLLRSDSDATVRAAAARGLGRTDHESAPRALLEAMEDENLWVRYYAVRSLGVIGAGTDEAITACLVDRALNDAPPVRIAAVEALSVLHARSAMDVVRQLCNDAESEVAEAARAALQKLEDGNHPSSRDE
jgi:HEAT repeat protein